MLHVNSQLHRLDLLGYCLMSNHVHLVVIPRRSDSLAQTLRHAHGRYAAYWKARQGASGHVWQGRYSSCPLDTEHLWAAFRYTELNPVRAGMAPAPELCPWSSAAIHCGLSGGALPLHLDLLAWSDVWKPRSWHKFLSAADAESDVASLRASTHTGRPLGSEEFVQSLERTLHRILTPQKGGCPRKPQIESAQSTFSF